MQGTYYLRVGSKAKAPRWRRSYGQQILSPLQLAFTLYEVLAQNISISSKSAVWKVSRARWHPSIWWLFLAPLFEQDSTGIVGSTSKFSTVANGYQIPPNVAIITLQVRTTLGGIKSDCWMIHCNLELCSMISSRGRGTEGIPTVTAVLPHFNWIDHPTLELTRAIHGVDHAGTWWPVSFVAPCPSIWGTTL